MPGITIRDADERDVLVVDLARVLQIAGDRALHSRWRVSGVDVGGGTTAEELHRISDDQLALMGDQLLTLARGVWQIIDGKFEAFEDEADSPWLTIYAVDSSAYDVVTTDIHLLEMLRDAFCEVSDLPESAL